MTFAFFVNDMYGCIKEYSGCSAFTLSVFAEGPEALNAGYTSAQECAVLRNKYAEDFVSAANMNPAMLVNGVNDCHIDKTVLRPGTIKVAHSCYPKNLRRWMKGTVSRKQNCRAELCFLIWCWYDCWLEKIQPDVDKAVLSLDLLRICRKYSDSCEFFSMETLWKACTAAYRESV